MKKGILVIFSGPSGVGKNTVRKLFQTRKELNLAFSVSATTRQPRNFEIDGKDYFFMTREKFLTMVENNEFLEYAEFAGNFYGTPKAAVEQVLASGKNVLLEIEVKGAKNVMAIFPRAVSIFLAPPSLEELKNRLVHRGTDNEEKMAIRLETAAEEMKSRSLYRFSVVNDQPEQAAEEVALIISSELKQV